MGNTAAATAPPTHLLRDVLARRPEGAGAAEAERFEGVRSLYVMGPLLPRRQGPRGDDLQSILLAQKLFFAEHLMGSGNGELSARNRDMVLWIRVCTRRPSEFIFSAPKQYFHEASDGQRQRREWSIRNKNIVSLVKLWICSLRSLCIENQPRWPPRCTAGGSANTSERWPSPPKARSPHTRAEVCCHLHRVQHRVKATLLMQQQALFETAAILGNKHSHRNSPKVTTLPCPPAAIFSKLGTVRRVAAARPRNACTRQSQTADQSAPEILTTRRDTKLYTV